MRRRPVWTTNVVAFLVGVGQFAGFILLPQYVQEPTRTGYGLGASPLAAGIFLLPLTVTTALGGIAVGRLERRFGAKLPLIAGNVLTGAGFGLLAVARGGRADLYCASALLGAGSGLALATLSTLIVANVAQHETGAAAGVNNVARTLGGAVGGQLAAAFLAASLSASGVGAPTADGYTAAFAVGLVAMIAATVVGPLLPGRLEDPTGDSPAPLGATVGLAYRR
jgi:MFS family permease